MGFVMTSIANVTVIRDQVLEEETGRGNIARKTILKDNFLVLYAYGIQLPF
ncbi:MAG: hypothetical protein ACE5RI_08190 [Candidatus Nitrosomaritimum yanchengensis]